ncbi:MAG: acetoacetate--CoA ligase [Actinomycetota bacterium]|nr:acetoacetate--CoA ligase [Actinomycetota bacterium]
MSPRPLQEGDVVWSPRPAAVEASPLAEFARFLPGAAGVAVGDYGALWRWSVRDLGGFWSAVARDARVAWHSEPGAALVDASMPGATWFPGGTLNYVDMALRRRGPEIAVEVHTELDRTSVSWDDLADQVRRAAGGLRRLGVGVGDRVAAYLPNRIETLVAFLATASLGAIWTVTPPEFGERSVLDRLGQVTPTVLLAVSGYRYHGVWHDRSDVVRQLHADLVTVQHVVQIPGGEEIPGALAWSDLLAPTDEPLSPTPVPFDHPLWIVYTSGTTGRPKSMVHGHGGVMLEHHKLHRLQLGMTPDDRFFWWSSTAWVVWNILVGGLLVGASIVIYDGSPTYPSPERLWDIAADSKASVLGLSAGFIQNALRDGHQPCRDRDLSRLRTVVSSGSPLPVSGYGWLADQFGPDLFIAPICGGTDVVSAFVGATSWLPVKAGAMQAPCLGVDVTSFDPGGQPIVGDTGELVVRQPMPSMPVKFWDDPGDARYRSTYFEMYPGVWRHGDWIRFDADGSSVVYGRSDATLNRGGVRMGTSDFYGVMDTMPEVADSLVIDTTSAARPRGELIVLVQPSPGHDIEGLEVRIRTRLRSSLSPRHNPDHVIVVDRLPHTLTGKRLEIPVQRLFAGSAVDEVLDTSAVDDPGAVISIAAAAAEWRSRAELDG